MRKRLAVLAVLPLTLSCMFLPETWPHETFTSERWKSLAWEQRYVLYASLEEQRLLDGATYEEVLELLGKPDGKYKPDNLAYLVRKRPTGIFDWHEVKILDIRFREDGKVERYFIRGT